MIYEWLNSFEAFQWSRMPRVIYESLEGKIIIIEHTEVYSGESIMMESNHKKGEGR